MSLSSDILKKFAKAVSTSEKKEQDATFYGTVVLKEGDNVSVQLDGSEIPTPVASAMDAENGDRVVVQIKDHKAVITGNTTSPASARSASSYIKLTEEGLVIGRLVDGEPNGSYCLIGLTEDDAEEYPEGTEFYYIMNADGTVAAKFGDNLVDLGLTDSSKIDFCNGRATIEYEHNVPGEIDSEKPTDDQISIKSNAVALSSEVVDKSSGGSVLAESFSLSEVYQPSLYDFSPFASVNITSILKLTNDGINFYRDILNALGYGTTKKQYFSSVDISPFAIRITTPKLIINEADAPYHFPEAVTASVTIAANSTLAVTTTNAMNVPTGYTPIGIRGIDIANRNVVLAGFGLNSGNKKFWARLKNTTSSSITTTITFYGFSIRNT